MLCDQAFVLAHVPTSDLPVGEGQSYPFCKNWFHGPRKELNNYDLKPLSATFPFHSQRFMSDWWTWGYPDTLVTFPIAVTKMSQQNHLRKGGLILGHRPSWSWRCGVKSVRQLVTSCLQSRSRERQMLVPGSLFPLYLAQDHGLLIITLFTLRAGLPSSVNPFWKYHYWHT